MQQKSHRPGPGHGSPIYEDVRTQLIFILWNIALKWLFRAQVSFSCGRVSVTPWEAKSEPGIYWEEPLGPPCLWKFEEGRAELVEGDVELWRDPSEGLGCPGEGPCCWAGLSELSQAETREQGFLSLWWPVIAWRPAPGRKHGCKRGRFLCFVFQLRKSPNSIDSWGLSAKVLPEAGEISPSLSKGYPNRMAQYPP